MPLVWLMVKMSPILPFPGSTPLCNVTFWFLCLNVASSFPLGSGLSPMTCFGHWDILNVAGRGFTGTVHWGLLFCCSWKLSPFWMSPG